MKIIKRILVLLFAVIVLAGIYYWVKFLINNQETKTMNASARKNTSGQFIELSGGITHYESGGVDTGKVIILVHGFSVPYYIWDGTYDSLVKAGFHVIRYDEFGRGFLIALILFMMLFYIELSYMTWSLHLNYKLR